MKCFYHAAVDAVGICTSCNKGICSECAVDKERAIACKERCEVEVQRIIDLRDYSFTTPHLTRKVLERTRSTYIRGGLYTLFTGFLFLGLGFLQWSPFFMILGGLGIVFAVIQMIGAAWRSSTVDHFRLCPYCGYNLTGNKSGKCPECGAKS